MSTPPNFAAVHLTINNKKITYSSEDRIVYFETSAGVPVECKMPEKWALTRVVQFMESLVKADSIII